MAFIEFGEQGSYQDPTQLQNALDLIRVTEKPLVITYVHGWQNNVQSDDVAKFESLLARLNRAPAIRAVGFHVVGVYLGWRGRLTPVPVLKEVSFWNRKATAERLASNYDCYDAIASISEEARKHGRARNYTVLLGHSFGGLIVERSVAHAVNAEIHGHADSDRSMPADLMIAVNPASDSILARPDDYCVVQPKNREHASAICINNIKRGLGNGHVFPYWDRGSVSKQGVQQGPSARSGQFAGKRAQLLYLDARP